MISINELYIVNYCHPNCAPFMNICRLPEKEAFSLASKMANDNPETTAFYRFVDFENYYPLRIKTERYLYELFVSYGGRPKETHPLSFVLQGSKYLDNWFNNGIVNKLRLMNIPSDYISFTLGDSAATLQRDGEVTMYTKEMLLSVINDYRGNIDDFMDEITEKYHYIEVQLWNDEYCAI